MKFLTSKLIPLLPFVLFILIYLNIYFFVYHVSQSPMMIIQDNDEEKLFEHENNNIPDHYLTKDSRPIKLNQTACVEYPAYFDLKFNNHHWQVLEREENTQRICEFLVSSKKHLILFFLNIIFECFLQ